ncbi:MAG: transcriptional repressor [Chloroflexales bacterium]|nr:transcriptional repressor [Chloroflexales bacterium]
MSVNEAPSRPARVNPEAWANAVRAAWHAGGLRATEPRLRVLKTITRYAAPFTAEQLYTDLLAAAGERPGRATVYRTLEQLHGAGWLARIHTQGGEAGYAPSFPGHLHHLVCTSCGIVIAFEGCALDELLERLAAQTSFAIEGHLLQLYGRCAACRKR